MTTTAAEEVKAPAEASEEQEPVEATSEQTTEESTADTGEQSPPSADEITESFLSEQGLADGEQETSNEQVAQAPVDLDTERERIRQQVREEEQSEQYRKGVRQSFEERPGRIAATLQQYNVPATVIQAVLQQFTEHNGQVQLVAQEDAKTALTQTYNKALFAAAEKQVKGISDGKYNNSEELMNAVVEGARKGYVPDKEVAPRVKAAVLAYKKTLEEKGLLAAAKEVPEGSGPGSTGSRSPDDILDDPASTPEQKDAAFERKHGFKPGR